MPRLRRVARLSGTVAPLVLPAVGSRAVERAGAHRGLATLLLQPSRVTSGLRRLVLLLGEEDIHRAARASTRSARDQCPESSTQRSTLLRHSSTLHSIGRVPRVRRSV